MPYKAVKISKEERESAKQLIRDKFPNDSLIAKFLKHIEDLEYHRDLTVGLTATGDSPKPFEIKWFEED